MENLAKQLKENWFIYAFIAGLILWYGNINNRVDAVEAKQAEQQTTIEKIDQLLIDMAVIKTDISYIKEKVK